MDLRILTRRPVATGTLLILVATALMIAVFFLGSFYLQHHQGYGALRTGLLFLPVAVATILGAQLAGRAIGGAGVRKVAVTSLLIAAAGTAIAAIWDGPVAVVAGISIGAAGIGAAFVASSVTTLSQVGHQEAGTASGLLSTFHEFGAALGVAVVSSLAAASLAGTTTTGFTKAFTFAAVTAAVAAVLALLLVPSAKPTADTTPHAHRGRAAFRRSVVRSAERSDQADLTSRRSSRTRPSARGSRTQIVPATAMCAQSSPRNVSFSKAGAMAVLRSSHGATSPSAPTIENSTLHAIGTT